MTTIRVTQNTSADPKICWDLIADFANIDFFNPGVSKSYMLPNNGEIGLGSTRQCDLTDGKNYIRERIIDWNPGENYTVEIYEGTMPIDNPKATVGVMPSSSGGSLVYMEMSYSPRYGLLGKIMNAVMMKSMMTKMLQGVVDGLKEKAELGKMASAIAA